MREERLHTTYEDKNDIGTSKATFKQEVKHNSCKILLEDISKSEFCSWLNNHKFANAIKHFLKIKVFKKLQAMYYFPGSYLIFVFQ